MEICFLVSKRREYIGHFGKIMLGCAIFCPVYWGWGVETCFLVSKRRESKDRFVFFGEFLFQCSSVLVFW